MRDVFKDQNIKEVCVGSKKKGGGGGRKGSARKKTNMMQFVSGKESRLQS